MQPTPRPVLTIGPARTYLAPTLTFAQRSLQYTKVCMEEIALSPQPDRTGVSKPMPTWGTQTPPLLNVEAERLLRGGFSPEHTEPLPCSDVLVTPKQDQEREALGWAVRDPEEPLCPSFLLSQQSEVKAQ